MKVEVLFLFNKMVNEIMIKQNLTAGILNDIGLLSSLLKIHSSEAKIIINNIPLL